MDDSIIESNKLLIFIKIDTIDDRVTAIVNNSIQNFLESIELLLKVTYRLNH